ncbi:MAG: potassium channel protein [Rhodobacterales bacterium]|nr:MAG: potassium channel protein [Rhodobacterales bacterium]
MNISPRIIATLLLSIIAFGTVFFHYVEGWNWVDAYFFSVVTLSTVGYGSLVPATAIGKVFTTIFIFLGLGIFAIAIHEFGTYMVRKRQDHEDWLIARLAHKQGKHKHHHHHHHHHHGEPTKPAEDYEAVANLDQDPEP